MSTNDDQPTLLERYSAAVESSNLKLGERRGDLDLVIAAGLVGDTLAVALLRLAIDYDSVRAEHRKAERVMREREERANQQTGEARERTLKEAHDAALTAHALILMNLPSLERTKEHFGEFARQQATKRAFMQPDRTVNVIAGRVLDVWLSPACRRCDGRGFNGATHRGERQVICGGRGGCGGSGHRRDSIGHSEAEHGFAKFLLAEIDRMLDNAQRDMRANVKAVDEAKHWVAEQSGVAL